MKTTQTDPFLLLGWRVLFFRILVVVSAICLYYFFVEENNNYALVFGSIFLLGTICYFLFWKKKKKMVSVKVDTVIETKYKETEEQKARRERAEKELQDMIATPVLVQTSLPDVVIQPEYSLGEEYKKHFTSWDRGDRIFPAIDPLFEQALQEALAANQFVAAIIRAFEMRISWTGGTTPFSAFHSFERDPLTCALSADQIIFYFLQNKKTLGDRNWFIMKTTLEEPKTAEDLVLLDIHLLKNVTREGKHFIYCYPFKQWSSFGGGYLTPKDNSLFFMEVKKEN